MSGQFDAYHKWLGIPPEEQPPHYYRLLAIRIFEDDVDVIEAAADQRMAHLRTLQAGKNAELSQRLLNELAVARACLLDERKRAQYNQRLKQHQSSRENASAASSGGEPALTSPSAGPNKSSSQAPTNQPVAELEPIENLADLDPLESMPPPVAGDYAATAGYYGPPQSAWPGYAPRRSKAWLIPAIIVASILLVFALIAFFAVLAVIVFYADSGVSTTPQISDSTSDDESARSALLPSISSPFGSTATATQIGNPFDHPSLDLRGSKRSRRQDGFSRDFVVCPADPVPGGGTEMTGTSQRADASMSGRQGTFAQSSPKIPPIRTKTLRRGPRL